MPRHLVLGNGSVLATFDQFLQLRDIYYPHVGMEEHTTFGNVHRLGVFVEGKGFSWLSDGTWNIHTDYRNDTLIGNSVAKNDQLGIELTVQDYVHPTHNILMRKFLIRSLDGQPKTVKIFLHHDFHIYGDKQKDTAFYEPYTNCVIHYRQSRYFLIGGNSTHPVACATGVKGDAYKSVLHSMKRLESCGISSFSIGKANYRGLEGTWRDAEDGKLENSTIEQGSVDSTVCIESLVEADKETQVLCWLCLGKSLDEVIALQQFIYDETPDRLERNCANYWKSWVHKTPHDFSGLPKNIADLFKKSLLFIRIHADNDGGIVAAADNDIMTFNRDTYTYIWPRDGAFICLALDRAGYAEVTRKFFEFCAKVITEDGYLMHKYNPDGSLGSSWHAWFKDGEPQLPIQEDETALVLYALWKHFEYRQDFEFLNSMFEPLVRKAGNFLCAFRDEETGLPFPSYDLWEEQSGIFTYTTVCTIAGLEAAANISGILGHHHHADRYAKAADHMCQALVFHLFDEEKGRFLKKIQRKDGKTIEKDATPDASMAVVWMLGVLPPGDPRVVSTMNQLKELLTVQTNVGGFARYTNDYYQSCVPPSKEIPGNPWILTTLWAAQWHIARATTREELKPALDALKWAVNGAVSSGILPEQLHPHTGEPISVAPLVWSHATFVDTVLAYLKRDQYLRRHDK